MRKLFFTVASVVAISGASYAQQGYASLNFGYGFSQPNEVIGMRINTNGTNNTQENIYGTMGAGLNIGLTPGYMLNDHFGMELGINYFMGSEVTRVDNITSPTDKKLVTAKTTQIRLNPSLVLATGGDKINIYAKGGLILPVSGSTIVNSDESYTAGPVLVNQKSETEVKGAFTVGYTGSLGAEYGISDKLSVFGELNSVNLRIKSKSATVNSVIVNGADITNTLPVNSKEIEYYDNVNNNEVIASDAPDKQIATKNNFGGLFINLGVKFNF